MPNRILIAEDEEHIAKLVGFKLEREGYEVQWAENGEIALRCLDTYTPDLIILDVMMPVMDGFTVLKHLKEDERYREIPVIMLTARGQEQDVVRGFDLGTEDYIIKPFRPAELLARVNKILKS